jgi:hypothetical protein
MAKPKTSDDDDDHDDDDDDDDDGKVSAAPKTGLAFCSPFNCLFVAARLERCLEFGSLLNRLIGLTCLSLIWLLLAGSGH